MQEAYDLSGFSKEAAEMFENFLAQTEGKNVKKKVIKKEEAQSASSLRVKETEKSIPKASNTTLGESIFEGLSDDARASLMQFAASLDTTLREEEHNVVFEEERYPIEVEEIPVVYKTVKPKKLIDLAEERRKRRPEESLQFEPLPVEDSSRTTEMSFEDGGFKYAPLDDGEGTVPPLEPKTEEEQERLIQDISENLSKQFEELEKHQKKEAQKTKKAQKIEIKRAKKAAKRYVPHKQRSIWKRIAHMKKYEFGYYDDLYDIDPAKLPEEEKEYYWEEVEELEDAEHDYTAFQAKKTAFLAGIAGVGLAITIALTNSVFQDIGSGAIFGVNRSNDPVPPTEIVTVVNGDTNLRLEENRAKGRMMKLQDQDYLRERINDNFIPEDVTPDEMLDIMEEAWRTLEPDVQKWVREPYKAHEAELRRAEEERQRAANAREIEERNNGVQNSEEISNEEESR